MPAAETPTSVTAATPSAEKPVTAERLGPYVRIIATLAVVGALWAGQAVWIPLVFSVLTSYALEPVVAFFASHRLPRSIGVPLVLFVVMGGCGPART